MRTIFTKNLPKGKQMARYTPRNRNQSKLVIVSPHKELEPGTLEHAIDHIIEGFDLSTFNERYKNDETGRKAIHPRILLKIILLGYSRGMTSSRPLEQACRENVKFMLLADFQTPDHSTIASFVSSIDKEVKDLFKEVLMTCDLNGLLGGTHFSLDGVKLSSNASKEWSGKFSDLKKKQKMLERKIEEAIKEHRENDKASGKKKDISWEKRQEAKIKKLDHAAKRIKRFLAESKPRIGARGKEVQSNITDNESAKMAATSHGVLQGYNANAVVDEKHQVIVNAEAFGKGEDSSLMDTMLEGAEENLEAAGIKEPLKDKIVSADTGYFSVKNLKACKKYEVDAYVPDPKFRKRDIRFADAERHRRPVDKRKTDKRKKYFSVEDFNYDDETNKLVCPAGHNLYVRSRNWADDKGNKRIIYQATKKACGACDLRTKCLRNPDKTEARQVSIVDRNRPGSLTDEMRDKIDTPEGRKMYSKRLGIVEPVFGNIRACKKMDRFTLRGKTKVNIQWLLYCIVHNIEKICNYGSNYAEQGT
jgi:transposase